MTGCHLERVMYQGPFMHPVEYRNFNHFNISKIQGITDNWSPVSSHEGTELGTEAGSSTPKPEQGQELQSLPLTRAVDLDTTAQLKEDNLSFLQGWDQYAKWYDSVLRRAMSSLGKEEYAQDQNSDKNQKEISTRGQGSMVTRIWSQTSDDIENELSMSAWMQTYPWSNVLIVWVVDERSELGKNNSHHFYKAYNPLINPFFPSHSLF
ncbi:hypothetical protein BYT27DRAFT_7214071 [Phlegmacium glaucopus]|nr:hypothetical protein BYT27DRAFT_7214071 [Phlegmacium glaucopus]